MERLYLDTSVFGGYFEPEFEYWTKILFERINTKRNIRKMKTKENRKQPKGKTNLPIMKQLRKIRDKISLEIKDMTYEQLKEYLTKQKKLYPKKSGYGKA
jgi:hypothetical protein